MTYTPDTDLVRRLYANSMDPTGFDRWLAAEEARIRADERQRIAVELRNICIGNHGSEFCEYEHAACIAEGSG